MDMMFNTPWYDVDVGTNVVVLAYGSNRVRCFAGLLPTKPEHLREVITRVGGHWTQHLWT